MTAKTRKIDELSQVDIDAAKGAYEKLIVQKGETYFPDGLEALEGLHNAGVPPTDIFDSMLRELTIEASDDKSNLHVGTADVVVQSNPPVGTADDVDEAPMQEADTLPVVLVKLEKISNGVNRNLALHRSEMDLSLRQLQILCDALTRTVGKPILSVHPQLLGRMIGRIWHSWYCLDTALRVFT